MKTDIDYHPQKEEEENSSSCLAEIVPYQLLQGVFIFNTAAVLSFTFFLSFSKFVSCWGQSNDVWEFTSKIFCKLWTVVSSYLHWDGCHKMEVELE